MASWGTEVGVGGRGLSGEGGGGTVERSGTEGAGLGLDLAKE